MAERKVSQSLPARLIEFMRVLSTAAFVFERLVDEHAHRGVLVGLFATHYSNGVQKTHLELAAGHERACLAIDCYLFDCHWQGNSAK
jgi:hypothetical protein